MNEFRVGDKAEYVGRDMAGVIVTVLHDAPWGYYRVEWPSGLCTVESPDDLRPATPMVSIPRDVAESVLAALPEWSAPHREMRDIIRRTIGPKMTVKVTAILDVYGPRADGLPHDEDELGAWVASTLSNSAPKNVVVSTEPTGST